MRLLTLIILLLFHSSAPSRDSTLYFFTQDERKILDLENSPAKVSGLIALYDACPESDTVKAKFLQNMALLIIQEKGYKSLLVTLSVVEAKKAETAFRYPDAEKKYCSALTLALEHGLVQEQAMLNLKLSNLYVKIGLYQKAMRAGLKCLDQYMSFEDQSGIQKAYKNLGNIHRYLRDYERANEYYTKSLSLAKELKQPLEIAAIYNALGITHKQLNRLGFALEFYKESFQIYSAHNDKYGMASYYNNAGSIHLLTGNSEQAFAFFNRALKLRKEIGDIRNEINVYTNLGRYYLLANRYADALTLFKTGLVLSQKLGLPEKQEEIHLCLSQLYEKMGDFQNALSEYKAYSLIKDSIVNNSKSLEIIRLEMANSIEREKTLTEIKAEKSYLARFVLILSLLLLLLSALVLLLFLRLRLRKAIGYSKSLAIERNSIEADLAEKDREIAAYSLYLAQKNEFIRTTSDRLRKNLVNQDPLKQAEIRGIINEIESERKQNLWDDFEVRFLKVHSGFYDNLMKKIPALSQNEKRLCAFLRLNMSSKEISLITGQTPHSINVARTRLRRKLGLVKNSQSISSFLSSV